MDRSSQMKAAMRDEIDELKKRRILLGHKMRDMPKSNGWDEFEHEIDEVISQLESEYSIIIKGMERMGA